MPKLRLAGLTAAEFMRRHWQKRPLLARGALPELADFLQRDDLFRLAAREDVESRLVVRRGRRWQVYDGPFPARTFSKLGGSKWSLLVHGVNDVLPEADRLLRKFAFVPYARLDDVMVSYAPPGGGVGPHYDSYDVFLAQGPGSRRWRIGRCRDGKFVPDAPLRVLRSFRPQREWVLETGDVLYLPPHYGHDGVAVTDCITVSIGFRAPAARELAAGFLEFMQDRLRLDGMYRDPDLRQQRRPAAIGARMIGKAEAVLERIDWGRRDVVRFLGSYLTEPKARVVFARPARALGERAFARAIGRHGVRLALATRMLFHRGTIFINGESREPGAPAVRLLSRAADRRMLPPLPRIDRESARILYQWYRAGYIEVNDRA